MTPQDDEIREWREAERATSDAYLRLRRMIPGAFDTPFAPSPAIVWETTETALQHLLDDLYGKNWDATGIDDLKATLTGAPAGQINITQAERRLFRKLLEEKVIYVQEPSHV